MIRHEWSEHEFLENHARLDINALHRGGALLDGAVTVWRWPNGLEGYVQARRAELFWTGQTEQVLVWDRLPFLLGRQVRPRFLCPGCGRGCYHLYAKAGLWACNLCCGFDWQSRHRRQRSPGFRRIAILRKKLRADPRPLAPLPPPPRHAGSRMRWVKIARALARLEVGMLRYVGRL